MASIGAATDAPPMDRLIGPTPGRTTPCAMEPAGLSVPARSRSAVRVTNPKPLVTIAMPPWKSRRSRPLARGNPRHQPGFMTGHRPEPRSPDFARLSWGDDTPGIEHGVRIAFPPTATTLPERPTQTVPEAVGRGMVRTTWWFRSQAGSPSGAAWRPRCRAALPPPTSRHPRPREGPRDSSGSARAKLRLPTPPRPAPPPCPPTTATRRGGGGRPR
jgi:hypothetical protein